jgi:hypothetical protein
VCLSVQDAVFDTLQSVLDSQDRKHDTALVASLAFGCLVGGKMLFYRFNDVNDTGVSHGHSRGDASRPMVGESKSSSAEAFSKIQGSNISRGKLCC